MQNKDTAKDLADHNMGNFQNTMFLLIDAPRVFWSFVHILSNPLKTEHSNFQYTCSRTAHKLTLGRNTTDH